MIRWKVELNNGEIAEEGRMPWLELPGERLPWPRLCAYLEENDLHITSFSVLKDDDLIFKKQQFYSCFVEYDMELDNIMGGPSAKTLLHTGFYYDEGVDHVYVDLETGEMQIDETDEYAALCPSRRPL